MGAACSRLLLRVVTRAKVKFVLPPETLLRFVPSRVEGLPNVTEVVVHPDRLELNSAGQWVILRFRDIARWPSPTWLWRLLTRLGWRPNWLPVADRDWFHKPPDRFFAFYSSPPVVVRMPVDEPAEHGSSHFLR